MIETALIASWALPNAIHLFWVIGWGTLVVGLTVAFFALMFTRRGRANPLRICIVLSLLVHILLAGYATTVQIVAASFAGDDDAIDIVVVSAGDSQETRTVEDVARPWERNTTEVVPPEPVEVQRTAMSEVTLPQRTPLAPLEMAAIDLNFPEQDTPDSSDAISEALAASTAEAIQAKQIEAPNSAATEEAEAVTPRVAALERVEASDTPAEPGVPSEQASSPLLDAASIVSQLAEAPSADARDSAIAGADDIFTQTVAATPASLAALDASAPLASPGDSNATEPSAQSTATVTSKRGIEDVPDTYKMRLDPRRGKFAQQNGGSPEAQSAVEAGLAWSALAQSKDGRWDSDYWGGGQERNIAGSDRNGAGAQADTGITGLTILAFLGAGHTHQHGDYQATVASGLTFLMRAQRSNGSLAGDAKLFARMYCHGMASFALSEAYAITGDERLLPAVQRAIDYIVASQDPRGGGWRYQPGDAGDTSQLGWQVMALKSAELAGIRVPEKTLAGIERFLYSVSSGHRGGLASYQPGRPANVAMTAEALVCRQFIGDSTTHGVASEAADYLITSLPSPDRMNLYYYYYATLALYPLQDERWSLWNAALQRTLIETQRTSGQDERGELTGSWDPDTAWGSHGGRAFTTAIATLSLEVYYRYAATQKRPPRSASRPASRR